MKKFGWREGIPQRFLSHVLLYNIIYSTMRKALYQLGHWFEETFTSYLRMLAYWWDHYTDPAALDNILSYSFLCKTLIPYWGLILRNNFHFFVINIILYWDSFVSKSLNCLPYMVTISFENVFYFFILNDQIKSLLYVFQMCNENFEVNSLLWSDLKNCERQYCFADDLLINF